MTVVVSIVDQPPHPVTFDCLVNSGQQGVGSLSVLGGGKVFCVDDVGPEGGFSCGSEEKTSVDCVADGSGGGADLGPDAERWRYGHGGQVRSRRGRCR